MQPSVILSGTRWEWDWGCGKTEGGKEGQVFFPLNMRGSGWDAASPSKIYLWVINYLCMSPSSYFSAFPRFSFVNRIRLFVICVIFKMS